MIVEFFEGGPSSSLLLVGIVVVKRYSHCAVDVCHGIHSHSPDLLMPILHEKVALADLVQSPLAHKHQLIAVVWSVASRLVHRQILLSVNVCGIIAVYACWGETRLNQKVFGLTHVDGVQNVSFCALKVHRYFVFIIDHIVKFFVSQLALTLRPSDVEKGEVVDFDRS